MDGPAVDGTATIQQLVFSSLASCSSYHMACATAPAGLTAMDVLNYLDVSSALQPGTPLSIATPADGAVCCDVITGVVSPGSGKPVLRLPQAFFSLGGSRCCAGEGLGPTRRPTDHSSQQRSRSLAVTNHDQS